MKNVKYGWSWEKKRMVRSAMYLNLKQTKDDYVCRKCALNLKKKNEVLQLFRNCFETACKKFGKLGNSLRTMLLIQTSAVLRTPVSEETVIATFALGMMSIFLFIERLRSEQT